VFVNVIRSQCELKRESGCDSLGLMGYRRPTSMNTVACIALELIAVFALASCENKSKSSLDRRFLKAADINIYINRRKINYYKSGIEDVQAAFRRKGSVFGNNKIDNQTIKYADFSGVLVRFIGESGKIAWMQITGKGIQLPGGFEVGDARSDVEAFLMNGIGTTNGYMYLLEASDGRYGDGYIIAYDNKGKINEILFGRVAHAP
jgi:hypothetical protein